ncbi:MAG: hypothetical protein LV473_17065 [Nitrospira sp.]|nr:hypothetical protein [Nitrospira sp.]
MANRRRRSREITSKQRKVCYGLVPYSVLQEFEECLKQVASYDGVDLNRVLRELEKVQIYYRNAELRKARLNGDSADTLSWLNKAQRVTAKLVALTDDLWSDYLRGSAWATNRRAALEDGGWTTKDQRSFYSQVHRIDEQLKLVNKQLSIPANRPMEECKQRGKVALRAARVPKQYRDPLLRYVLS